MKVHHLANDSGSTTVCQSGATAGTCPGSLICTAVAHTVTFVLRGSTIFTVTAAVPAIDSGLRDWPMLSMMGVGLIALGLRRRAYAVRVAGKGS